MGGFLGKLRALILSRESETYMPSRIIELFVAHNHQTNTERITYWSTFKVQENKGTFRGSTFKAWNETFNVNGERFSVVKWQQSLVVTMWFFEMAFMFRLLAHQQWIVILSEMQVFH